MLKYALKSYRKEEEKGLGRENQYFVITGQLAGPRRPERSDNVVIFKARNLRGIEIACAKERMTRLRPWFTIKKKIWIVRFHLDGFASTIHCSSKDEAQQLSNYVLERVHNLW